jgi:7,8-dihydropterin-6-yl-methyl-4-(beta-D-ribofuranosyl)aminobenzene 5'-phosphate synthase
MIIIYIIAALILLIILLLSALYIKLLKGNKIVAKELSQFSPKKISNFGEVNSLSIIPIVEYFSARDDLLTEPGVSYFVKTNSQNILLDVGYNVRKTHPSPLLHNMNALGININDIDSIFFSHAHGDHLGGVAHHKNHTFGLSSGPVELKGQKVYATEELKPSPENSNVEMVLVKEAMVIDKGISSLGPHPRNLYAMGIIREHSLVVNMKGKGLVVIIGCGHQTIEVIIKKVKETYDEPIYAIIGGLHFPVNGGRGKVGPFNIQQIVSAEKVPWKGINENDIDSGIEALKDADPQFIYLSGHDSSDFAIEKFKKAFGSKLQILLVGEEYIL